MSEIDYEYMFNECGGEQFINGYDYIFTPLSWNGRKDSYYFIGSLSHRSNNTLYFLDVQEYIHQAEINFARNIDIPYGKFYEVDIKKFSFKVL